MSETYKYRTQHLRGTSSEWSDHGDKIVPLEGEIVIELDKDNHLHKLKIGDGETSYSDLAYLMAGDEIVSQVLPRIVTVQLNVGDWKEPNSNISGYYQTKTFDNITPTSRLDLQPSLEQIDDFQRLGIIFTTENRNTLSENKGEIIICANILPSKNIEM